MKFQRLFKVILENTDNIEAELEAKRRDIVRKHPELDIFHVYLAHAGHIYVQSLRVDKDHRGKGVGSSAMEELMRWARTKDLTVALTPEADPRKKAALERFYKRLGFKKNSGRSKDFRISGTRIARPDRKL